MTDRISQIWAMLGERLSGTDMALVGELAAELLSGGNGAQTPRSTDAERAWRYRQRKRDERDATVTNVTERDDAVSPLRENQTPLPPETLRVSTPSRGKRLPDDWCPTENLLSWAKTEVPGVDVRFENEAFADHFRAQPGARGTKVNWNSTWKNWMREAMRRGSRFKPKADNVTTFKPSSGVKWLDVSTQYIEKWGRELALKKYNEDLDKGEVLGWLKQSLPSVHRNSA
jgi:hypothetical protein